MNATLRPGSRLSPRLRQILHGAASTIVLLAFWQLASYFTPPYLFPPLQDVFGRMLKIFVDWALLLEVLETAARIFAGLFGAFLLGAVLALLIGRSSRFESWSAPVLVFLQGIPALSWVVIAIIWFHGSEFRIFFIMVITTLPAFTFQILDAYRSMSKDLFEMTMSFRPSAWILFRFLIVPTIVPGIITAFKVNLGNSARVVVVAELVGATGGVGYQLLMQQQLFDMAGAIAWTLQLVLFVLVTQSLLGLAEAYLLRYRPVSERTA
jgi:NitT/TauT family transport system permease protein